MRIQRTAAAAMAAAALVGALGACTSSGKPASDGKAAASAVPTVSASPSPTQPDPKAALAAAAAVMDQAGSAKIDYTGTAMVGDGTGVFVWKSPQRLQLDGAGDDKVRYADGWVYLNVADKDLATFDNRHWMKFDQQGVADKVAGAGSLVDALAFETADPAVELSLAAQSNPIWVGPRPITVGSAQLPTDQYEATLTVQSLVDALPGLSPDLKPQVLAELKKGGDTLTVYFWIDAKGRLVRQRTVPASGGKTVTVSFTDIGADNKVDTPAANDTADVAAMLKN